MTGQITVTPEGRPDIYLADRDSLKAWITAQGFEAIHNFCGSGRMMLGADHEIPSVLGDIDQATKVGILTGSAQDGSLGHALALVLPANDAQPERLELYDIGPITEADLDMRPALVEAPR